MNSKQRILRTSSMVIFQNINFLRLWVAQFINLIGDQIYLVALPWFVYNISQSGSQMSIVFSFETLPYILFGVIGGALTDSFNKRNFLIFGNLMASVPLFSLFVLYQSGELEMWHIYMIAIFLSCIVSMVLPSFEAIIPSIVQKEQLVSANSLMELIASFSLAIGPFIAGLIISIFDSSIAIVINAISFLLVSIILFFVRVKKDFLSERRQNVKQTIREQLKDLLQGITFVPTHKILRWGMVMSVSVNIILGAYNSLFILLMRTKLNATASVVGIVMTVTSVVSIVVAFIMASKAKGTDNSVNIMILTTILQGLGVITVGISNNVFLVLIGQIIYTGFLTLYTIHWRSLRQAVTPSYMIGRVSGVSRGVAYAGASLGGFFSAFLVKLFDLSRLFLIEGLLVIMVAIITSFLVYGFNDNRNDTGGKV